MTSDGTGTLDEAVANIQTSTKDGTICPEASGELSIPRAGSCSLPPDEEPIPFLSPADALACAEKEEAAGAFTVSPPSSTSTTSGVSYLSGDPHTAGNNVIDRSGNSDIPNPLQSARPKIDPDPLKCLRYPWHDPFMGAPCPWGKGECSKPFPWLSSSIDAEAPNWAEYGSRSEQDTRSETEISVMFQEIMERNNPSGPATDIPTQNAKPEPGISGQKGSGLSHTPASIQRTQYLLQDELPSSAMRAQPASEREARVFNPNIDPFGNSAGDQATQAVAIVNYMEDRLSRVLPSAFHPNRQSGEPGPVLDGESLRGAIDRYGSLPPTVNTLMSNVFESRRRYLVAWDLVLKKAHGLCDLQAEQVQLWREVCLMNFNSMEDNPGRRRHNAWRQNANDQALQQTNQEFKTCEAGLVQCMKQLVELKTIAARNISNINALCEDWLQRQRKEGADESSGNKNGNNREASGQVPASLPKAGEKKNAEENP